MDLPDWLGYFSLSIKDYDIPCVMCNECLTYLADQWTDGMCGVPSIMEVMEKHWRDNHAS